MRKGGGGGHVVVESGVVGYSASTHASIGPHARASVTDTQVTSTQVTSTVTSTHACARACITSTPSYQHCYQYSCLCSCLHYQYPKLPAPLPALALMPVLLAPKTPPPKLPAP